MSPGEDNPADRNDYKPTALANAGAGCMGCMVLVLILAICTGLPYLAFRSLRPTISSLAPAGSATVVGGGGNAAPDVENLTISRER